MVQWARLLRWRRSGEQATDLHRVPDARAEDPTSTSLPRGVASVDLLSVKERGDWLNALWDRFRDYQEDSA